MNPVLPRASRGFSLVEISIALGVAAFCLLAIVGLLQTGLTSEQSTVGTTSAWGILSSAHADMASTPQTNSQSVTYGISFAQSSGPQTIFFGRDGSPTGPAGSAPTAKSYFRLSVGMNPPAVASPAPALARLLVTWPAAADPSPSEWPSHAAGSVEVVTALDRN